MKNHLTIKEAVDLLHSGGHWIGPAEQGGSVGIWSYAYESTRALGGDVNRYDRWRGDVAETKEDLTAELEKIRAEDEAAYDVEKKAEQARSEKYQAWLDSLPDCLPNGALVDKDRKELTDPYGNYLAVLKSLYDRGVTPENFAEAAEKEASDAFCFCD